MHDNILFGKIYFWDPEMFGASSYVFGTPYEIYGLSFGYVSDGLQKSCLKSHA